MSIDTFKAFIKDRLGLHFGTEADARLGLLLRDRMALSKLDSVADYLGQLDAESVEFRALTSLLTINESYFYREPQHLRLLTEQLAPPLLERARAGAPVRILSVGCAAGEEPYSIAIALRESLGEPGERLFRISACDVDGSALARARAGIYGPLTFRALPCRLRDRYFTPADATHRQLAAQIRRQVEFFEWNLLGAEQPRELQPQDLIFFRNVSIYFDVATRQAVITRLRDLLDPGGHLIVGATETLANDFGLLRLHVRDGVFLFAKDVPDSQSAWPAASRVGTASPGVNDTRPRWPGSVAPTRPGTVTPRPATHDEFPAQVRPTVIGVAPGIDDPQTRALADYQQALLLMQEERFEAALQRLAPLCARADAPAQWFVLRAWLHLERGDAEQAAVAVDQALHRDAWSTDALLLLARCARLRGDSAGAIRALRRVIYDNPSCWRAHYQLAEVYRGQDERALARREYRIVLRQLADETCAMPGAGELPSLLSAKDLRFLCETRLACLVDTAA